MKSKQDVIKVNGSRATTLIGQAGYSDDAQAFMLKHGELMVICTSSDGPNYMTKKQAIEMFGIKRKISMTDIKSQILTEVEKIGGNVIAVADAMEKCPTLSGIINAYSSVLSGGSIYKCNPAAVLKKPDDVIIKFKHPLI